MGLHQWEWCHPNDHSLFQFNAWVDALGNATTFHNSHAGIACNLTWEGSDWACHCCHCFHCRVLDSVWTGSGTSASTLNQLTSQLPTIIWCFPGTSTACWKCCLWPLCDSLSSSTLQEMEDLSWLYCEPVCQHQQNLCPVLTASWHVACWIWHWHKCRPAWSQWVVPWDRGLAAIEHGPADIIFII